MFRPIELDSLTFPLTWDAIVAADRGDVGALRALLAADPRVAIGEYWYTPVVHFAVREGHGDAVQVLLDAGADPEWNGLHDGSLSRMARDRGFVSIATLLDAASLRRRRVITQPEDHTVHTAAERGGVPAVRAQLDADPTLVNRGDATGMSPLHRAVCGSAEEVVAFLLERGADVHARCGAARGLSTGLGRDHEPIDLALFRIRDSRRAEQMARLLVTHGAAYDLTVAAALGDIDRVREMLDADPARVRETRPSGRRPLSAAVEFWRNDVIRLLLERGTDPRWHEPYAPSGGSLHTAAQTANREAVDLLLLYGADPNADVDSAAKPYYLAATPEVRAALVAGGASLDPFDEILSRHDDEAVQRVAMHPQAAERIGFVFAMVCGDGKREMLAKLLAAGLRMPPVLTSCQGYLLSHADMLRTLLDHGMSPDVRNWQGQTLLHLVSGGTNVELAAMLLDAGANITARDEEYCSTPLGWAARANAKPMVEFLLARGAPPALPDDPPWATALAWAERRGHEEVAALLQSRM
jgi:ankyrin repeat protein